MIRPFDQQLLDKLKENKKLTEQQYLKFVDILERDLNANLDNLLKKEKIIEDEELAKLKAELLGKEYVSLMDREIPGEILNLIPIDISENYKMIAFNKEGDLVSVGMVDPLNAQALEALDFLAVKNNWKIKIYVITQVDFKQALYRYRNLGSEVASALEHSDFQEKKEEEKEAEDEGGLIKDAPISKIVSVIIHHGVEAGASDIHVEPTEDNVKIRYRIDGLLQTSLILPAYLASPVISRIKVLASMKLDETRIPQDGRIKVKVNNKKIDLRVSTLPLLDREKVTMRILDKSKAIPTFEDLGFVGRVKKLIEHAVTQPYGMILVTGPTGSGKSTTLLTALNYINNDTINIVTLEDPIEYEMDGINQSQVRPQLGYTFATGLRTILRQDPDVIMVGEIRDFETAEMSIHAGLTGHLLLSTLHTNDAFGAIPRLIDMHVEPFLLASTLNLVLAQRLVRRVCEHCKEEVQLEPEVEEKVRRELSKSNVLPEDLPPGVDIKNGKLKFYKGKGCPRCRGTGYKGRYAIAEGLEMTDELKKIIIAGIDMDLVKKELYENQKMLTMQQDGFIKALKGITTVEEVLRVTEEEREDDEADLFTAQARIAREELKEKEEKKNPKSKNNKKQNKVRGIDTSKLDEEMDKLIGKTKKKSKFVYGDKSKLKEQSI